MQKMSYKSYRSSGSHRHSHKLEDTDKKKSVYATYAVMKPLTTYKIKELIYEKLIANGQLAILKHLLREHLYQSGWVYQFRKACLERLKTIGVENINVSHLVSDMVPVGRELFTQHTSVRQEMHSLILAYSKMFIKTDPSALLPLEYPKSPPKNEYLLYQARDAKPEPRDSRKRPHQRDSRESRDHHSGSSSGHGHKSSSKKSKTESRSGRSRSRNSNHSRSSNRSHKGRSSSRSHSRSPSGIRSHSSTVQSSLPTKAIESQPPTLIPHSLSSHHTEKVQHHRKEKEHHHKSSSDSKKKAKKSFESSSSSSRDLHRHQPPPIKVQPIIPVKAKAEPESEKEDDDEEEEELPDI